jgi:hypothetical protein
MTLTTVERERITDGMLKLQSARATLGKVEDGKIPEADEIDACLKSADRNLKVALGYARPKRAQTKSV